MQTNPAVEQNKPLSVISPKSAALGYDLWRYTQRLLRKRALKRGTSHSKAKIRLVQHCAAISPITELLHFPIIVIIIIIISEH